MTKDIIVICTGMLAVGVGVWSFWGNPQSTKSDTSRAHRGR